MTREQLAESLSPEMIDEIERRFSGLENVDKFGFSEIGELWVEGDIRLVLDKPRKQASFTTIE